MRIAAVDGASGHIIDATVSLEARGTPIRGAFVTIQTGADVILGRISEVVLSNPIHNDDLFAPMIMKSGNLPYWSGEVDIERAKIEIVSVLDTNTMDRIPLRRNPASGTAIHPADQKAINLFSIEKQHCLVLGHIPNSGGLLASIINRHNGPANDDAGTDLGGHGEARHTAIFGQSGSAKTVLLTMLLAGRLAAHPKMGLLMPDTSGDLADPTRHSRGRFRWNYADVLKIKNIDIERMLIGDIRLTSPETLKSKLQPILMRRIRMASDNAWSLSDYIVEAMVGTGEVNAAQLTGTNILQEAINNIARCYSPAQRTQKAQDLTAIQADPNSRSVFDRDIADVQRLFDGRITVRDLVRDVLENGRKVIVEMLGISQNDQKFVMHEVMRQLINQANRIFYSKKMSNAAIVLDEGQRWVPEGSDDEEGLSELIKDGFRTTRKLGIGWYIVAQSPAGLSKKVIRDCHTWWFGRNLGIGADRSHVEDMLSQDGAEAYRQLAIQGGYFWVAAGLDNNLGTGTTYFSLHPFGANATQAFIEANPQIFGVTNVAAAAE
jgi:hypothetical protein